MSAAEDTRSEGVAAMAMPTRAAASAGASLMPSPTITNPAPAGVGGLDAGLDAAQGVAGVMMPPCAVAAGAGRTPLGPLLRWHLEVR